MNFDFIKPYKIIIIVEPYFGNILERKIRKRDFFKKNEIIFYKNINELVLSKQIKLSFKNLNEEDSLYQSKLMCDQILVNTNIQDYEISLVKKD